MSAGLSSQVDALRTMLEAVRATREAGYTHEDVQKLVTSAFAHIEDGSQQPYAFGRCSNCCRVVVGCTAYHCSIVVNEP